MKKNLHLRILNAFGWQTIQKIELPKKCVICLAPHTSNWDFAVGILFKYGHRMKANFFIKKEWFFFPMGSFMKAIGGIPIDRNKKNSITDQIAEEITKRNTIRIAIAPEGTRKANPDWKKGFYFIALKANVPIVLAFIDFKTKEVGLGEIFHPTGDVDADMTKIKEYYKNITGKYPHLFKY